jgi:hypothetical protein
VSSHEHPGWTDRTSGRPHGRTMGMVLLGLHLWSVRHAGDVRDAQTGQRRGIGRGAGTVNTWIEGFGCLGFEVG